MGSEAGGLLDAYLPGDRVRFAPQPPLREHGVGVAAARRVAGVVRCLQACARKSSPQALYPGPVIFFVGILPYMQRIFLDPETSPWGSQSRGVFQAFRVTEQVAAAHDAWP